MIILSDIMAIKADKRCFSICYLKKHTDSKTGELVENWQSEFYFTDPESLFRKLIKLAVYEGINTGSWEAVRKSIEAAQTQINNLIRGELEVS
jgi:Mor family transcriptional regulator